ncbi:MAG TPA: NAD(P)H-dependent oxidoreductase [Pseudonocardia sp.]|jgi:NAD(P)H-dependent FMN reductase|nr:NAD(P)H-dependent oxidoreductase [Pseudonocardia sp.]
MTDNKDCWNQPITLEIVIGSVRPGRFGPVVARWFSGHASARPGLRVGLLDLLEQPRDFAGRIGSADAVAVVTPEYNHSYPGPLKTAIDSLGSEWRATPVGFVSYGGLSGGLRAVEPLRIAFAELHAVTVRETVSFHSYPDKFDQHGQPTDEVGPAAAADALLDQLTWWGRALRAAKLRQPYGT